jgi:hypothetical protein
MRNFRKPESDRRRRTTRRERDIWSRNWVYWPWPGRYSPSWLQRRPSVKAGEGEATPAEEVIPTEEATQAEEVIPGRVEGSLAEEGTEATPAEEGTEATPAEEGTEATLAEETTGGTPAEEVTTVGATMTEGGAAATTVAIMVGAGYPSDSTAHHTTAMGTLMVQAPAAGTTISGVIGNHIRATGMGMAIS